MHSALMYYRNCHCKTLFKISQYGGTARRAGVFKTCRCGDDRISRDRNHDHGILGKQGSDRTCGDEVESGSDFCSLHDITSESENESNMGDGYGRSDESGNVTHLKSGYRNPTGFRRWGKVAGSGGLCYTCVMGTWKSKNRHKYLLQYHIIFVCKYRKKLLMSKQISDDIKQFSYEICQKHKVIIRYMETDKDHIYYMIETEPTMSISKIVNLMKNYTTYHIWKRYPDYLRKHFWKEHTFWTDGYFVCSVGNVSEEMLRKYIENQG